MAAKDDLKKFVAELSKEIKNILNKSQQELVGKEMRDIIYRRTKSGKGVTDDTSEKAGLKSLKKLSPPYIEKRKTHTGQKGEFFSPTRSNLTLTGQMLSSLTSKSQDNKISVYVKDNSRSDGNTNNKIAEYVSQQGREFLNLAVEEQRIVKKRIEDMIRENIRRKFGKGA